MILSNPKWTEILLTCFSKDLNQNNDQLAIASKTIQELNAQVSSLKSEAEKIRQAFVDSQVKIQKLVNIILALRNVARDSAVLGTKGWFYVQLVNESIEHIAQKYFPMIHFSAKEANTKEIREQLDAAQKTETRPNPTSVYESIKNEIGDKAR